MILLVDMEKAFDKVSHDFLKQVITNMNLEGSQVDRAVNSMYNNVKSQVIYNNETSSPLTFHSGVRQGCPLSPTLFALVIEPLLNHLRARLEGLEIWNINKKVNAHADDIAIFLKNKQDLDKALSILKEFGALSGLNMNIKKSVIITKDANINEISSIPTLKNDPNCKYLGYFLEKDPMEEAWTRFIKKITRWKKIFLSLKGKFIVLNSLSYSIFYYFMYLSKLSKPFIEKVENATKWFLFGKGKFNPDLKYWSRISLDRLYETHIKTRVGIYNIKVMWLALQASLVGRLALKKKVDWNASDRLFIWEAILKKDRLNIDDTVMRHQGPKPRDHDIIKQAYHHFSLINSNLAFKFKLGDTSSIVNDKGRSTGLRAIMEKPSKEHYGYVVMDKAGEIEEISLEKLIHVKEHEDNYTTLSERQYAAKKKLVVHSTTRELYSNFKTKNLVTKTVINSIIKIKKLKCNVKVKSFAYRIHMNDVWVDSRCHDKKNETCRICKVEVEDLEHIKYCLYSPLIISKFTELCSQKEKDFDIKRFKDDQIIKYHVRKKNLNKEGKDQFFPEAALTLLWCLWKKRCLILFNLANPLSSSEILIKRELDKLLVCLNPLAYSLDQA